MGKDTRPTVRIGTWNTWWAAPKGARGARVRTTVALSGCDILCVTEGSKRLLPAQGHVIDGGTNWDYPVRSQDRRKVLVWSREPWTEVDCVGSEALPGGRFVKGLTATPVGPLTVVGVCIPWSCAHVRDGRRDRTRWQDHRAWLEAFDRLPCRDAKERTVILGDFNQRVPRTGKSVPRDVYELLQSTFSGFEIATAGELLGAGGPAIDHIAHTSDLTRSSDIEIWRKRNDEGESMSDHFGVWADFELRDPPAGLPLIGTTASS